MKGKHDENAEGKGGEEEEDATKKKKTRDG